MTIHHLNPKLFRQNAIDHLYSQHEILGTLKIIEPSAWCWLLSVVLLFLGVIVWGIYGSLTFELEATGILIPSSKIKESERLIKENINDHNDTLSTLQDLFNKKRELYTKHLLTKVDLLKAQEDYIAAKEAIANPNKNTYLPKTDLYNSENSQTCSLDVLVFINNSEAQQIKVGMETYVLPKIFSPYQYGYIKAEVTHISSYPISKQLAYAYLGNMNLVDDFFLNGAPFLAKIKLTKNPDNLSGLSWTTHASPNFSIAAGSLVSAKIIYRQCSPFNCLFK